MKKTRLLIPTLVSLGSATLIPLASCGHTIPVTGITLNKEATVIAAGLSETLVATLEPETATEKTVTWTSSDAETAKVDEKGNVTAIKKGSVDITVTTKDGAKSATCKVWVLDPILVDVKATYSGGVTTADAILNTTTLAVSGTLSDGQPKSLDIGTDYQVFDWLSQDVTETIKSTGVKLDYATDHHFYIVAKVESVTITRALTITVTSNTKIASFEGGPNVDLTKAINGQASFIAKDKDGVEIPCTWSVLPTTVGHFDAGSNVLVLEETTKATGADARIVATPNDGGEVNSLDVEIANYDIFDSEKMGKSLTGGSLCAKEGVALENTNVIAPNWYYDKEYYEDWIPQTWFESLHSCGHVSKLFIPANVKTLTYGFIYDTVVDSIVVDKNNAEFTSVDSNDYEMNCMMNMARDTVVQGCVNTKLADTITKIDKSSFVDTKFDYVSGTGPMFVFDNINSIGWSAFKWSNIKSVDLSNSKAVIEAKAFFECNDLEEVKIGANITEIKEEAFASCPKLQKVWIDSTAVSKSADDCKGLLANAKTIYLSKSIAIGDIGEYIIKNFTQTSTEGNYLVLTRNS